MNRSFLQSLQVLFLLLDLIILNLSYLLAEGIFEEDPTAHLYLRYLQFWLIANGFWIVLSWLGEVYYTKSVSFFESFLRHTMRIYFVWAVLILLYMILPRKIDLSNSMVISVVIFFFVGLLINRFIYLAIRQWVKQKVYLKRRVLILGYSELARTLATYLEKEEMNIKIVGFADNRVRVADAGEYPLYTNLENVLDITRGQGVNEIYSTIMPENNYKVYKIMQQADKELIRFKVVADFSYFINRPVHVDFLRNLPILTVRREPLEDVFNRLKKRMFDIAFSLFVTVFILSWLVPLLGLLIYLESPGPIFFVQQRSGKNNKPFGCYKFRSMRMSSDANTKQATRGDSRITRVGKFIRKTSLDEFPQFINVLKGEMSIVGPRPHMLKHTEDYSQLEEQYMIRQFLKPGITGWAQVNGYRGEITELHHIKKRVEYDLWYLENWSLSLDLRIVFLTVYNVFKGEENAF